MTNGSNSNIELQQTSKIKYSRDVYLLGASLKGVITSLVGRKRVKYPLYIPHIFHATCTTR